MEMKMIPASGGSFWPRWTGQIRPTMDGSKPANGQTRDRSFLARCGLLGQASVLRPPAARAALEHVGMVKEPVEHRAHGRHVAEQLPPVVDRPVRRDERARALVPAHN